MKASGVRVVTFDADQTLLDFQAGMRAALDVSVKRLASIAPDADVLTVDDLIALRNAEALRMSSSATMEAIRHASFRSALAILGADLALATELTDEYLSNRFRLTALYDDALPALLELRRDYVLGLATNGNSYPDRSGLTGVFTFAVLAQEQGVRKPDPEFFRRVIKVAMVDPWEIVHVGDSEIEDITAAQSVDIRAVWLNREGRRALRVTPWAEITSLAELPAILNL